jgi:hypothetical protein
MRTGTQNRSANFPALPNRARHRPILDGTFLAAWPAGGGAGKPLVDLTGPGSSWSHVCSGRCRSLITRFFA